MLISQFELKLLFTALGDRPLHSNHDVDELNCKPDSFEEWKFTKCGFPSSSYESISKNTRLVLPEEGWGAKAKIEEGEEQAWDGGDGGGGGGGGYWGGLTSSSWAVLKVEVYRTSYMGDFVNLSQLCAVKWITFDFFSQNSDLSFEVRLLQGWWLKDVDGRKATMASILVTRMSWDLPPSAGGATHTYTLTTHLTLERKRGGVFGKNDTVSAEKRKGNCKLYSPLPITLSPSTLLYTAHPYNPFPPPSPSINYQTLSLLIKSHIFGPCYKIYL